jgi:hypothetical protein
MRDHQAGLRWVELPANEGLGTRLQPDVRDRRDTVVHTSRLMGSEFSFSERVGGGVST